MTLAPQSTAVSGRTADARMTLTNGQAGTHSDTEFFPTHPAGPTSQEYMITLRENTRAGGKHATKRSMCAPVAEVGSLRLGRYPFVAGIKHYANSKKSVWNPDTTRREEIRKLIQIGRELEALKADGRIPTTDPRAIQWPAIQEWMASIRHLDPDVQAGQVLRLNRYLKAFKNYEIEAQLESGYRLPRASRRPIRVIDQEDLEGIFEASLQLTGWTGSVARGMVALYFATGVRPSELRLGHIDDLNMRKLRFFVRHPKGEGNWATPEWVDLIRADVLPMVQRYLDERSAFLASVGRREIALFPKQNGPGFYSANRFRLIKNRIAETAGVDFKLKDFRSTLTTMTVNGDISRLPAMSSQLRHSTTATTEKFYARIDRSTCGRKLRDAWKENELHLCASAENNPVIDSEKEVSGYD